MKLLLPVLTRAGLLGLLWMSLAGWSADYAVYGVISVVIATAFSVALLPPRPARPRTWVGRTLALLTLAAWFVWQSVRGGVDVAIRAIRPSIDIDPRVVTATLDLPEGSVRQVALILMNLMPGSMVQRLIDSAGNTAHAPTDSPSGVELHTLSLSLEPANQWRELQRLVGRAAGTPPQD